MTITEWNLFPYPTISGTSILSDGSLMAAPEVCRMCQGTPCITASTKIGELATCTYGMTYARLTPDRLIVGVVVTDGPQAPTKAAKKRRRSEPGHLVITKDLRRAIERTESLDLAEIRRAKVQGQSQVEDDLAEQRTFSALLDEVKNEIGDKANSQHDILLLVKQIQGHVKAILEERYPSAAPEDAAERVDAYSEGAIFFTTELLLGKLEATRFLTEPNLVHGQRRSFALHAFITKYVRIYGHHARQKSVDLMMVGTSFGRVRYNDIAVGVVIHALLDNMVKYAPASSKADIIFEESASEIRVTFESFGPLIEKGEEKKIFLPGYRGNLTRNVGEAGLGFGLAAARRISDLLELDLTADQDADSSSAFPARFKTRFRLSFEKLPPSESDRDPNATGRHRKVR